MRVQIIVSELTHSSSDGTKMASPPDLIILGAGRQGRNINDVCLALGRRVAGFLDDTKPRGTIVNGVPVLGGFALAHDAALLARGELIVGVGDNEARARWSNEIRQRGGRLATVIHPTCIVSASAAIGVGTFISGFARVLANAEVGDYVLIEGLSSIGADCIVEEGAFIGPGVQLTAGSRIRQGAMIGAGAVVLGREVGAGSIVGAGATVTTDIPPGVLAVGTPATIKKQLDRSA